MTQPWSLSWRADPYARTIADRHYNRQAIGEAQFVPPGRCLVLKAEAPGGRALWVTSWPFAAYVKHAWAGAWICSAFRNEGAGRASDLITAAVAATRARYGDAPPLGMVTFLDRSKVRATKVRSIPTFGRTWALAGFHHVGETGSGLMAWQLLPADMPPADPAIGSPQELFA